MFSGAQPRHSVFWQCRLQIWKKLVLFFPPHLCNNVFCRVFQSCVTASTLTWSTHGSSAAPRTPCSASPSYSMKRTGRNRTCVCTCVCTCARRETNDSSGFKVLGSDNVLMIRWWWDTHCGVSNEGCWWGRRGTGRPTTGREMCTNALWARKRTQPAIK